MTTDQKRALGLAVAGAGGLAALYKHFHGSTTATNNTSSGAPSVTYGGTTGGIAPYTPQQPVTLQPNESVYNPNNNLLATAPGTNDTVTPAATTPQASAPGAPAYVVNVSYPATHAKKPAAKKPAKRKVTKPKSTKVKAAKHG
jgi:hypothetical protein